MNTLASDEKLDDWEARWAPYDEPTYQAVLQAIQPDDLVLDIGAGDLRLACRMAAICRGVIAIERQPALLRAQAASPGRIHPDNLTVLVGDARQLEFPQGITAGVLLMRHCTHYQYYACQAEKGRRTQIDYQCPLEDGCRGRRFMGSSPDVQAGQAGLVRLRLRGDRVQKRTG